MVYRCSNFFSRSSQPARKVRMGSLSDKVVVTAHRGRVCTKQPTEIRLDIELDHWYLCPCKGRRFSSSKPIGVSAHGCLAGFPHNVHRELNHIESFSTGIVMHEQP